MRDRFCRDRGRQKGPTPHIISAMMTVEGGAVGSGSGLEALVLVRLLLSFIFLAGGPAESPTEFELALALEPN